MQWHVKRFLGEATELRTGQVLQESMKLFDEFASTRTGASMFSRQDDDGSIAVYLPPIATDFAKAMHALPCERPSLERLSWLCGQEETWDFYFEKAPTDPR